MVMLEPQIINLFMFGGVSVTLDFLFEAVASSTRLVNSGVTAEWVEPVKVWSWNLIKILTNLLWLFFYNGVTAGLYGRLYRESEREFTREKPPAGKPAIWRRA